MSKEGAALLVSLLILAGCGKSIVEGSTTEQGSNPTSGAPPTTTSNPTPPLNPTCESDAIQTVSFEQGDPVLTQFLLDPTIIEGVQSVSVDGSGISFSYDARDGQLSFDSSSAGHVGSIVDVTECLFTGGKNPGKGPVCKPATQAL